MIEAPQYHQLGFITIGARSLVVCFDADDTKITDVMKPYMFKNAEKSPYISTLLYTFLIRKKKILQYMLDILYYPENVSLYHISYRLVDHISHIALPCPPSLSLTLTISVFLAICISLNLIMVLNG